MKEEDKQQQQEPQNLPTLPQPQSRPQSMERKGGIINQQALSPQSTSQMSNYFPQKGPIKPQILLMNQSQSSQQNSGSAQQPPQARDFIRSGSLGGHSNLLMPSNSQRQQQQQMLAAAQQEDDDDDEYYGEEDENGEEGGGPRAAARILNPEQEQQILRQLYMSAQRNREFYKVLDILQNDPELRPLIFEHEALLNTLKDMMELKAEQMLSILTAAETEMYESTRLNSEQQQIQQQQQQQTSQAPIRQVQTESKAITANLIDSSQLDLLNEKNRTASFEIDQLKKQLRSLENEKMLLTTELNKEKEQRQNVEKEQECTFKNLSEENKMLKRMNETLKKNETDTQMQFQNKEKEFNEEMRKLKSQLRQQEELRVSMLQDKSKLEVDLKRNKDFINNLENEIDLLEKDNENLHRKMNITYNSLLTSQINQQQLMSGLVDNSNIQEQQEQEMTPAKRNLSHSFQTSGQFEGLRQGNSIIYYPGIGQSTQRLKLLMSDNKSGNSFVGNSLYFAHQFVNASGNNQNYHHQRAETMLHRSNSIEVILLDNEESKKQNIYALGEEEKQPSIASAMLQNKASWLKTKGLFTDLSPINSQSSQQIDHTSRHQSMSSNNAPNNRLQQRQQKLQDVQEEQHEIIGNSSPYNPTTQYYDEQVRKLHLEIEKLKEANNMLTQKLQSQAFLPTQNYLNQSSPSQTENEKLVFATPQNSHQNYRVNQQPHAQYGSNQIPQNSHDQSPIMMATFSKEKDRAFYSQQFNQINSQQSSVPKNQTFETERERYLEQQYEKIGQEFKSKLQELGSRLVQIFRKLNPLNQDFSLLSQQEYSVSLLKDLIFEISIRIENLLDQHSRSRQTSQVAGSNQIFYGGNQGSNVSQVYGLASNNNSTTMEMTPFDIRNLMLEEKEKRLLIQEELNKTKEQHIRFQIENEKLKNDLQNEKVQNQTLVMSHFDYNSQNYEQINKLNHNLQARIELLQDENVNLKLKISEIEDELLNERQGKQIKYEVTIESFKSNLQGQYLDQKIRFEELLLTEKESNHKLRVELQGLIERNQVLKDQLQLFRDRINELEKESIQQSKENYVLQNELDYENVRTSQLQTKQDRVKQNEEKTKFQLTQQIDTMMLKYESKLKEMQYKLNEQELIYQKQVEIEKITKDKYDDEIYRLKGEIVRLSEEIQNQNFQSKVNNYISQQPSLTNSDDSRFKQYKKKVFASKIKSLQKWQLKVHQIKAFFQLRLISFNKKNYDNQSNNQILKRDESYGSGVMSQQNLNRIQQLEENIYKWQNDNSQLVKVIAKLTRYVNQKQPIKLNLSGLISKITGTLDYILSGLKNNTEVCELNICKCDLDDEDLTKIYENLRVDQGIVSLKIGNNKFQNLQPLLDLLVAKGKKLKGIDISDIPMQIDSINKLPQVIRRMDVLQELSISGIIKGEISQYTDLVNNIFDSIFTLKNLKAFDVSRNRLSKESIEHLFYNIRNSKIIETLSLNSIGIDDKSCDALMYMLSNQQRLRKLYITNNKLSSQNMSQVLKAIRDHIQIEDLDLSKSNFNNDINCFMELSLLIQKCRTLRSLSIQKCGINDNQAMQLVQPLGENLCLQVLKIDFNQLGPNFIEKLSQRLTQNKLQSTFLQNSSNKGSQSSLMDDQQSDTISFGNTKNNQSFSQYYNTPSLGQENKKLSATGFMQISLEGNMIGDRGAIAISDIIRMPNDSTKNLKLVNLNECGITVEGFEELKNALVQRASLATTANLSHVKITIERNNVDF